MKFFVCLIVCFATLILGSCADREVTDTMMEEIVADVSAGGKKYVGKTVRLQATVSLDRLKELLNVQRSIPPKLLMVKFGRMLLATNNENVIFWVDDDMGTFVAVNLPAYHDQQTYTFTLDIKSVTTAEGRFDIVARLADD